MSSSLAIGRRISGGQLASSQARVRVLKSARPAVSFIGRLRFSSIGLMGVPTLAEGIRIWQTVFSKSGH